MVRILKYFDFQWYIQKYLKEDLESNDVIPTQEDQHEIHELSIDNLLLTFELQSVIISVKNRT